MKQPIKVLIIEDAEDDAALLISTLQHGGYDPVYEIVETPEAMADALDRQSWDLMISDYSMPLFSGLDALKMLQEKDPDLSFILLTGQVGEDVAVEAMKAGAHDYILKSNRARLIPTVERELRDTQARRKNRQNEQALRESLERYRLIVETANAGVWQLDEEDRTIFVNQKMADMLGYTVDEMMGQTPYTFMEEEWSKIAKAKIQHRRSETWGQIEYKFQRKDGTDLWMLVGSSPIFRDDGRYAGAIGTQIDVTERKQAEKELRESEERFRLLFDGSQDAIMTIAPPSWKYTSANPAALKMFGARDAAELTALGPLDVSPERQADGRLSADNAKEMIETALRQGSNFFEWTHRRLDSTGTAFPANVLLARVEIAGQVCLQATVRDITAQKQAEDALRESEERHRHLIENSHDIIYTLTPDGVFTFVSPAWTELLGHPVDQVVGQPFQPFVHADDVAVCMDFLQKVIETGRRHANVEYRVRHADGSWRWHTTNGAPLWDKAGTIIGFEGIARDITERKQAEDALRLSGEKYRTIFNATGTPAMIIEEDTTIALVNRGFENLSGYSKQEIEGKKSWKEFVVEDYLAFMIRCHDLRRVDPDSAPKQYESEFIARQGDFKQVIVTVSMIPGTNQSIAFLLDISMIKQAEKEIKQSETKFRTLFEEAPVGVGISQAGKTLMANQAYLDMFGYAIVSELEGTQLLDQIAPHCRSQIEEIVRGREQGKEVPRAYETVGLRKDGSQFPFYIENTRIELPDGPATLSYFTDITESKQAEAELRFSEERFSKAFNVSPSTMSISTFPEGRYVDVNEAYIKNLGYRREELIGYTRSELNIWGRPADLAEAVRVLYEQKSFRNMETLIRTKSGELRIGLVSADIFQIGGADYMLAVFEDITERKLAQEALRFANHRLEQIIEFLPDATYVVDCDKKVIAWNRAIEEQTQILKEDMLGKGDNAYTVPYYGIKRANLIDLVLSPDSDTEKQYDYVKRIGNTVTIETYAPYAYGGKGGYLWAVAAPLYDINGKIIGVIESIRDITERKQAEEELRSAHQQLAQIIEFLPDATFVIDSDRKIIAWNKAVEEMTGVGKESIIGKGDYAYAVPFYGEPMPIMIDLVLIADSSTALKYEYMEKTNTTIYAEAYVPYAYQGRGAWLWGTACPLVDDEGNVIGAIESIRDITERKRTEEELEKHRERLEELVAERTTDLIAVNQELEAFTHSVAHDLRAPLRSISGFSQILLENYADRLDKQGSEHLERLKASSQHMSHLIEDLLDLSRVTSAAINREQTDLSAMARAIAADLIKEQPERQAHFDIQDGITVFGDPDLLYIMLQNLLDNAWKFTSKKAETEITFGITIYEGRQAYYVRDNGAGFDMAHAGKLFEPFQRLHSAKEFTGTGIGLASVQRIIRRHGGQIWAEGEAEKGATIYFTLHEQSEEDG